jgi:ribosomal protein L28
MARKKKNDTAPTTRPDFAAAAEASAKASAPVQTRFDLPDEVTEYQEIELRIPLSADEVTMLERRSAEALADADEEAERLKAYAKPITDKIKKLRKASSADAKGAKAGSRAQTQRVRVVFSPNTATVRFFSPETGREVQLSRAMTPGEMARIGDGPMSPPDGDDTITIEADADGTGDDDVDGEA